VFHGVVVSFEKIKAAVIDAVIAVRLTEYLTELLIE